MTPAERLKISTIRQYQDTTQKIVVVKRTPRPLLETVESWLAEDPAREGAWKSPKELADEWNVYVDQWCDFRFSRRNVRWIIEASLKDLQRVLDINRRLNTHRHTHEFRFVRKAQRAEAEEGDSAIEAPTSAAAASPPPAPADASPGSPSDLTPGDPGP